MVPPPPSVRRGYAARLISRFARVFLFIGNSRRNFSPFACVRGGSFQPEDTTTSVRCRGLHKPEPEAIACPDGFWLKSHTLELTGLHRPERFTTLPLLAREVGIAGFLSVEVAASPHPLWRISAKN